MNLRTFIERPILSAVISISIVVVGIIGLFTLHVEQYPDIAPPTIQVSTSYFGASAETLQKSVIAPLEEAINGVENMTYMTSVSYTHLERLPDENKECILIIDDNADVRGYVKSLLKEEYTVIEAADGHAGLKQAMKYVPDAIICDVMMPVSYTHLDVYKRQVRIRICVFIRLPT